MPRGMVALEGQVLDCMSRVVKAQQAQAFLVALSLSGGLGVRRSLVLAVVVALAILITARQERLTAPAVAVTATSVACGALLVLVPVAA